MLYRSLFRLPKLVRIVLSCEVWGTERASPAISLYGTVWSGVVRRGQAWSGVMEEKTRTALIAFALIYVTFFLDNVLLTVLVPIIPDWVRGESLELWARHEAPLVAMLNGTVRAAAEDGGEIGSAQATVGLVLSAKAGVQLVTAPLAAAATSRRGPAAVLRAATALLALAAIVFSWCGRVSVAGGGGVWCACAGRAVHGCAAALASVSGLAMCSATVPAAHAHRAIGALLGAVALGVLVGYPFGGATYSTWSRGAPFLLIAAALLFDLAAQYVYLQPDQAESGADGEGGAGGAGGAGRWEVSRALAVCRSGAVVPCAGAVLLTTTVMAALEPSLPLWLQTRFGAKRWQAGVAFVPDSAGYLLATSAAAAGRGGGAVRAAGPERVALAGQLAVALAALAIPHATSVAWLAAPHAVLGCGLGATDAALVPALLARHAADAHTLAALLQAAASAAYALGPVVGGVVSWWLGFESTLRILGVLNLLYVAYLYRALRQHPLSEHWGACPPPGEGAAGEGAAEGVEELAPLRPRVYTALH